jgi:large subunit ribosomal protein L25
VEIECLPTNIPEAIELDVSGLEVGDALHVSDLKMEGVEFLGHPETTVAQVSLPAAERSSDETAEAGADGAATAVDAAGADGDGDKKGNADGGS